MSKPPLRPGTASTLNNTRRSAEGSPPLTSPVPPQGEGDDSLNVTATASNNANVNNGGGNKLDLEVGIYRTVWPSELSSIVAIGDRALVRYSTVTHQLDLVHVLGACPSPRRAKAADGNPLSARERGGHLSMATIASRCIATTVPPGTPMSSPFSSIHVIMNRTASAQPHAGDAQSPPRPELEPLLLCVNADRKSFTLFNIYPALSVKSQMAGIEARYFTVRATGSFPNAASHFVPFLYRGLRYALGYDHDTGRYWVLVLASLCNPTPGRDAHGPSSVMARGTFRKGWTHVVWKGTHHVRCTRQRFFCYSAATGESLFECIYVRHSSATSSLCSREHVQFEALPTAIGDSPASKLRETDDEQREVVQRTLRRKGCVVVPLILHQCTACLLYTHTSAGQTTSAAEAVDTHTTSTSRLPESTDAASVGNNNAASAVAKATALAQATQGSDIAADAVLLLQKRVFAHSAPWTHFCTLRDSVADGDGDDLLFCYAASTGTTWINRLVLCGRDEEPEKEVTLYRRIHDTDRSLQLTTAVLHGVGVQPVDVERFADSQAEYRHMDGSGIGGAAGGAASLSIPAGSPRARPPRTHRPVTAPSVRTRVFHKVEALEAATATCSSYNETMEVIIKELAATYCQPEGKPFSEDTLTTPRHGPGAQEEFGDPERRAAFQAALEMVADPDFCEDDVKKKAHALERKGVFSARSRPASDSHRSFHRTASFDALSESSRSPTNATSDVFGPLSARQHRQEWQSVAGVKGVFPPPRQGVQRKYETDRARYRRDEMPKKVLTEKKMLRLFTVRVSKEQYQEQEIAKAEATSRKALIAARKKAIADRTGVALDDIPDGPTPAEVSKTLKKLAVDDPGRLKRSLEKAREKYAPKPPSVGAKPVSQEQVEGQILRLYENAPSHHAATLAAVRRTWNAAFGPQFVPDTNSRPASAGPVPPIGPKQEMALADRLGRQFLERREAHLARTLQQMDHGAMPIPVKLPPDVLLRTAERLSSPPPHRQNPPSRQGSPKGHPATAR
jgi:hypothetical protein